jgi:hypothetical protein
MADAYLHGYLDDSIPAPEKTITTGTDDAAVTVSNPDYARWWSQDQKVLGLLLGSMDRAIACQLIDSKTAAAAWTSVHAMFSAQSRANVRHIPRQLQTLRKDDLSAAEYMDQMKSLIRLRMQKLWPFYRDIKFFCKKTSKFMFIIFPTY